MSEKMNMITARDPDIVAAEINTIKKNVQQIMIAGALEIGGKLVEAKGMVPYGQWGDWLASKVNYSQSTANNLMKLYNEYGGNQQSLFDTWTNSQAFAELPYTKHLALLALPFSERQEFVESNQVAEMSTRELEKRIREELAGEYQGKIQAAEQRAADAEERASNAEAELEDAVEDRDSAKGAARDANAEANEYLRQKKVAELALQKAEKEKADAEKSEKNALNLVKKLEQQLKDAKAAENTAVEELQRVRENPDIPDGVMANLRKEAAQKAADELSAQLDEARQAAAKAEQEKAAAKEAARVAAAQLEEMQKTSKLANPDMMAIQTLAESMMTTWNTILERRLQAVAADPNNAKPINGFLSQMLANMGAGLDKQ